MTALNSGASRLLPLIPSIKSPGGNSVTAWSTFGTVNPFLKGPSHDHAPESRLYSRGTAGGDRHYRHPDCVLIAGAATDPGSGATRPMREQPHATGTRDCAVRIRLRDLALGHDQPE